MTIEYRDQNQDASSSEEEIPILVPISPSSSSDEDTQLGLCTLSSPFCDYKIVSFLGEGTFGKVAKCIKSTTQEKVAVKIMNSTAPWAEREVHMLKELSAFDPDRFNFVRHGNIFYDKKRAFIEFEELDINLWDYLETKRTRVLSLKEIRPILHQIAITLQLLSSQGIVHTDLKPDNIMLVDQAKQPLKVKVIDFGLACHASEITCGQYLQPRYYRSPESLLGCPITTAIDMWSLGCIAAELFLGYPLYPGSCEYDMLRQIEQTQGHLPQKLLKEGIKTDDFYRKMKGRGCRFRLKTRAEYGGQARSSSYFQSLDDIKEIRPLCHLSDDDTIAEEEDLDNFIDLLKQMLHLDANKRITASQLLEDPFITMNNLVEDFPDSFYVKACCEMMEVCRDQTLSSDRLDQQPQPSTSTTSQDQYTNPGCVPAWLKHPEHPLVLGITSSISSSLSIHADQQLQDATEAQESKNSNFVATQQELPQTSTARPVRKRTWDTFIASHSGLRRQRKYSPERKKMKMSPTHEAKPSRKRTCDTFISSDSGLRTQCEDTPQRKKMRMSPTHDTKTPPIEAPSIKAENKPSRKRTCDTFISSDIRLRTQSRDSPERNKTKKSPTHDSKETPIEAPSIKAENKPSRKRTRDTFVASHSGLRTQCRDSPERKKMRMSPTHDSKTPPIEAPSIKAENKPSRKRTWDTFVASHDALRTQSRDSPERKKMKMSVLHESTETKEKEVKEEAASTDKSLRKRTPANFEAFYSRLRSQNSCSPVRRKRKLSPQNDTKTTPIEASSSVAENKPGRKRTRDSFEDSHIELRCSRPAKKRKLKYLDEAETQTEKPQNSEQASCSRAKSQDNDDKNPDCSFQKKTTRRSKTFFPETPTQTRSLRKRKGPY